MVWVSQVDVEDVWFQYPTRPNTYALEGVSLSLKPGNLVALVGLSGSGKSTLVSLIERHYDPTRGKVGFSCNPLFDQGHVAPRHFCWSSWLSQGYFSMLPSLCVFVRPAIPYSLWSFRILPQHIDYCDADSTITVSS
jgi:energy-coupling factor transporter ATP-binding protein EcfA2